MIRKVITIFFYLSGFVVMVYAQNTVDKNATKETMALYKNLQNIQGKNILFGHQDDTAYGIAWKYEKGQSDVKKVTGDYPAVCGWDLGHIELRDSANIDNVLFSEIKHLMIENFYRGGINTVSWHLRNPYTDGSAWDVASNEVVKSIIPGGSKHDKFMQWLDTLSGFFKSLRAADGTMIPVLFRPFHEHTGNWFWWGKAHCSKDDYIKLWQFTVSYLRDVKKVHNLLYVYSPDWIQGEQEYFDRYPGDKYIDVLGLDLYHRGGEKTTIKYISDVENVMRFLSNYAEPHHKAFVFSETGENEIATKNWFTEVLYRAVEKYRPAYVLLWRNAYETPCHFFVPYPGHPATDDFIRFKNKADIIFAKELPAMYK